MSEIESVNRTHTTDPGNKLMVGSLDVKALYPSLDIPFAAKVIAQEFTRSEIDIEEESIIFSITTSINH